MPKTRVPIHYRRGSWEVKKGQGRWKFKYTAELTEQQVKKNLALESPGAQIKRFKAANSVHPKRERVQK